VVITDDGAKIRALLKYLALHSGVPRTSYKRRAWRVLLLATIVITCVSDERGPSRAFTMSSIIMVVVRFA